MSRRTQNGSEETMWRSCFKNFDKGFLWNVDGAEGFHALFPFLLFLEQLAFAGDVAAVAFGGDIFAQGADGFAGDDLAADGPLDGHGVLLAWDDFLEFGRQGASPALRFVA